MKTMILLLAAALICAVSFAQEPTRVEVSVSREGVIALAGHQTTVADLQTELAAIAKKGVAPEVLIVAASEAPLNSVSNVVTACRNAGITHVRLQSKDSKEANLTPARVEISVSKEGVVALAGQQTTLEDLQKALAADAKKGPAPEALIVASSGAPLKSISSVMTACRNAGVTHIRLQSDDSGTTGANK